MSASAGPTPPPANRLAHEKSPYLRQHRHNPVDWRPWGEEAFARARAEQKPIFLSIGYSTCHWCHVMAHESFEHAGVAALLNAHFVPVKVDREERPDLDRVYMTYVQAATGSGGWPMSVWLTPDLKPFYGGTYFPPEDRAGRAGLLTILRALAKAWAEDRAKLVAEGDRVVTALRQRASQPQEENRSPGNDNLPKTAGEAFQRCFQQLYESHDPTWGGFGSAPKFPHAATLNFLFRMAARQGVSSEVGAEAVRMAAFTLQKMAEGGLHDHVGGGFHRYSVDEEWFVPHFEKMLYDQAQIAPNYLEARQATGREVFAWVARDIFDYVARDLTSPEGAFYSAEDADSAVGDGTGEKTPQAEGAFYVWTKAELEAVLGDDAALFCAHFGVAADGNVPEERDPHGEFRGKNILRQRQSLTVTAREAGIDVQAANEKLLRCLARLREARAGRPRPHRDDKIITAWNGLMISALARGHQVLECHPAPSEGSSSAAETGRILRSAQNDTQPGTYLAAAARAAEFLQRELYDAVAGTLFRSYREGRSGIEGFAEDYAFLIQGLLDLYEAGFDVRWLQWAERLQAKMDGRFWDAERGGYFNSRADDTSVVVRLKEDYDGAEPAPSSVAALNLLRLAAMLGGVERTVPGAPVSAQGEGGPADPPALSYRERAGRTIDALRARWDSAPHALPQMLCAIELALEPPRTVVIAGNPDARDFRALAAVLHERLGPRRAVLAADGGEGQRWLAERMPYLAEMTPQGGRATAYVCENFTCRSPVMSPPELRRMLWRDR